MKNDIKGIVIYGNDHEKFFQYDYRFVTDFLISPMVELYLTQYHKLTRHNRYEFNLISKSNGGMQGFHMHINATFNHLPLLITFHWSSN